MNNDVLPPAALRTTLTGDTHVHAGCWGWMQILKCRLIFVTLSPSESLFASNLRTFLAIFTGTCVQQFLVHGQVTIIFVVSVGLSVCLSVCLFVCAEFFSAIFDPISIKLGHMLYVWV